MSVVVMGKGELAVRIARYFRLAGKLKCVVPVSNEPNWTTSLKEWAESYEVTVETDPVPSDLVFSVFYDRILKADFIGSCGLVLNLHNSPLPNYRGVSPINWALKNGETFHGVTIHEVDPGIDTGAIYGQLLYSVYPFDEVKDVYQRAIEYGWTLFKETIPLLGKIIPREQGEGSYYTKKDNKRLGDRSSWTRAESIILEHERSLNEYAERLAQFEER